MTGNPVNKARFLSRSKQAVRIEVLTYENHRLQKRIAEMRREYRRAVAAMQLVTNHLRPGGLRAVPVASNPGGSSARTAGILQNPRENASSSVQ
jgi:hypothetical protein